LRDGDVLVVTKLDRVGRSVGNLVTVAADLHGLGVDLIVLDQAIDTATPAGRILFHVLAAIPEFEHDLIAEEWPAASAAATSGPPMTPAGAPRYFPTREATSGCARSSDTRVIISAYSLGD
jgi:DNA invertase Pin-like site-specific DNA recombinase